MSPLGLDDRSTFDAFIVGAANRLACAAARRVSESPGTSYNPLFIYSASGLGKTHLVNAIGLHAQRVVPDLEVKYETLEHFMEEVTRAVEAGEWDDYRDELGGIGLLLLDDVQFLAGRHRVQEELLRAWDTLSTRGGQVVLTSDRPPQEIDGLDDRLLSRFSGGLIVDIGAPDYETRVAIVRRKAEERGQPLGSGVAEALAKVAFANVRELQGALNRIIAVQELEGRSVKADEVDGLLGGPAEEPDAKGDEFGEFLAEISDVVEEAVTQTAAERQLADAILRWEGEGYRTRRLEETLADADRHGEVEAIIRGFEADVERLREIGGEIVALDVEAPERGRLDVLRDPDRLDEAEALLGEVRERTRPLPAPPMGRTFESLALPPDAFAVRVAVAAAEEPGERYNPLFIHGPAEVGKSALLEALGQRLQELHPEWPVAYLAAGAFEAELIGALEHNRVESWRARYRRAKALLVDDVDALAGTELAQEELFHLVDALQRAGVQLAFTSSAPPAALDGIEDRLRTRLGSGLVVELTPAPEPAEEAAPPEPAAEGEAEEAAEAEPVAAGAAGEGDGWFLSREKVVWDWPYLEDWLVEELE